MVRVTFLNISVTSKPVLISTVGMDQINAEFLVHILGAARTFYLGLGERKKYDFDYLVDSLKRRFASQNLSASWRSRLQSRKRKVGECIRQLGDDLWKMAVRGHPGLDLAQPENEWILLEAFYNAIESENSVECIRCDCRNMHDAIDVVERYETSKTRGQAVNVRAITNPAPNQAPAQPFVPHTPAETPAAPAVPVNSPLYMEKLMQVVTELSAGQQRLESQVSQQQVAGRSYSSDRRSNYNNGGDRRSFYGKGGDRNTHPNRGAQGNTRPAVVCYNCKQQGHYQRECVNPPQQAQPQQCAINHIATQPCSMTLQQVMPTQHCAMTPQYAPSPQYTAAPQYTQQYAVPHSAVAAPQPTVAHMQHCVQPGSSQFSSQEAGN